MLRRDYKSQCERRSAELRKSLGLTAACPLPASDLAKRLGATVWSAADIEGVSESDFRELTVEQPDSWSAFTICRGDNHLIVFNSAQSIPRINSVVMHELSHIILGHELTPAEITADGHLVPSNFDQNQEDEADWLGGALLLPRPALVQIRKNHLTDSEATETYLVSSQMLTWRFRMTGVDYQIANSKKSFYQKQGNLV